ncbi:hypothetical protein KJ865_01100, partial [Myxococcota bacterium]|nr:hypothetical protein [Myxococcota bacterium]
KRRREAPPPPPKPAHETAFTRLDALKSRGLPEDEETKDFAFELSEIMREYCGNRYHFYSLEMTTTELLQKLSEMHPAGLPFDALSEYFDTLDLVKFAKMPLQPAEFPPELEKGYEFVRETMKGDSPELTDEQEENPEVNAPVGAGMTHTLDDSLGDEDARYLPPGTLETPMTPEPEDAREEKVTTGSEETPAPRPPEPETSEETPAAPTDDTESKYLPPPPDIEPVETVTPPQEPESPEESPGSPQEESDREDHRWDGSGSPKDKE